MTLTPRHRLFGALLCGLLAAGLAQAAETVYTFAVVPQFTPLQTHRDWTPILERLEQKTGLQLTLQVYEKIPAFEADLLKGVPDFVYMNPYHLLMARQTHAYQPLVRDGASKLSGILVALRDSKLKNLSGLNGLSIAFPAPNAFGASLYLRALLAEKEHLMIKPVYVGNHENVYRQVLQGDVIAGGVVEATFNKEPAEIRAKLKVLYSTPATAPHPVAAHPRVSTADAQRLTAAFLQIAQDPDVQPLLTAIQIPTPVRADFKRDYAPLGNLRLERYVVAPK